MERGFKNIMEDIVCEKMDEILPSMNCCICEQCKADIAAYTLNRLPPKYVVSSQGEVISRTNHLDKEFEMKLIMAIAEATCIIQNRPRHK